MLNLPLTQSLGARFAGIYVNRDGYTKNLHDGARLDGRDIYAVRASLRWEPSSSTTIDLLGYYFHEKDNRLRIQKQKCLRDPTGVLGCLPGRRSEEHTSELQSLMRISYAVFCLKNKKHKTEKT